MKPYIIYSPLYNNTDEISVKLHIFCRALMEAGCEAYIAYPDGQIISNDYSCLVINQITASHLVKYREAIVCYPESKIIENHEYNFGKNHVRLVFNSKKNISFNKKDNIFFCDESIEKKIKNKKKSKMIIPIEINKDSLKVFIEDISNFIKETSC